MARKKNKSPSSAAGGASASAVSFKSSPSSREPEKDDGYDDDDLREEEEGTATTSGGALLSGGGFQQILRHLSSKPKKNDMQSIRLSAVTSALVETTLERKRNNGNEEGDTTGGGRKKKVVVLEVTAGDLYASCLTALEGTVLRRNDEQGMEEEEATASSSSSSPQMPLLQLMEVVIPYVVDPTAAATVVEPTTTGYNSPLSLQKPHQSITPDDEAGMKLFVSQFPLLSRILRGITTLHNHRFQHDQQQPQQRGKKHKKNQQQHQQQQGGVVGGGSNAILRQTLSTTKAALIGLLSAVSSHPDLVSSATTKDNNNERAIGQLVTDAILVLWFHPSPKVRKFAQSSATELTMAAACCGGSGSDGGNNSRSSVTPREAELILGYVFHGVHSLLEDFCMGLAGEKKTKKKGGGGDDDDDDDATMSVGRRREEEVKVLHLLQFVRSAGGPLALAVTGTNLVGGSAASAGGGLKKKKRRSMEVDEESKKKEVVVDDSGGDVLIQTLLRMLLLLASNSSGAGVSSGRKAHVSSDEAATLLAQSTLEALLSVAEYDPSVLAEERDGFHGGVGVVLSMMETRGRICSRLLASLLQNATPILALASSSSSGGRMDGDGEDEEEAEGMSRRGGGGGRAPSMLSCWTRLLSSIICTLLSSKGYVLVGTKLFPLVLEAVIASCASSCDQCPTSVVRACSSNLQAMVSRGLPVVLATGGEASVAPSVRAVKKLLHSRFQPWWEFVLPAAYATSVVHLAKAAGATAMIVAADDLLQLLVQLHADLTTTTGSNGSATSAVEAAVGVIVEGVGVETFLEMTARKGLIMSDTPIPSQEDETIGDAAASAGAGSSAGAGGMRKQSAWLVAVIKSRGKAALMSPPPPLSSSFVEEHEGDVTAVTDAVHELHLSFFQGTVLQMARRCDAATATAKDGVAPSALDVSIQKQCVIDLWSLFPVFCQRPADLASSFPALAPTLAKAVQDKRYPQLVTTICTGIQILSVGAAKRAEEACMEEEGGGLSANEDSGMGGSAVGAQADFRVLSEMSVKLLPTLFRTVETLTSTLANEQQSGSSNGGGEGTKPDDVQRVQAVTGAIGELARLCPKGFLQNLFKKVMQKLILATTQQEQSDQKGNDVDTVCTLLRLAHALVSSAALDESSVSLLYRATKPLLLSSDDGDGDGDGKQKRSSLSSPKVQKQSYKVFSEICAKYTGFIASKERLQETTDLLVGSGSIMACHVSARHMRLKCLMHVVEGLDPESDEHMSLIPQITGEILLCLKDSNGKTRESAYELLLSMAKIRNDMTSYVQVIVGALGAQTRHMRSAAVMALSRLVYEFARFDETVQSLLPSLLQTVLVLFNENAREIIKSVVGFVRVSIAAMSREQLEPLLPDVVDGLMKFNKGKDRFRAKIKIILKKLVRTYGYEAITPLVPAEDTRLLTHMRKLAEREVRKKAAAHQMLEDGRSTAGEGFDELMNSDEEDSDGGRTLMTGVTGFTRMTARSGKTLRTAAVAASQKSASGKSMRSMATSAAGTHSSRMDGSGGGPRLKKEKAGEVMDMLSPTMARNVGYDQQNADSDWEDDDDDGGAIEFDSMGKIVVPDPSKANDNFISFDGDDGGEDEEEENEQIKSGKRRRLTKYETAKATKAEAAARRSRKKQNEAKQLGSAYKSKKAGGDVKKKGQKYEPYAYVPLDGKNYTKKHRNKAVSQMATVVRGGKRKRK